MKVTESDGKTFYRHLTNSLYISNIRSKSDGDGEKCIKKFFVAENDTQPLFLLFVWRKQNFFLILQIDNRKKNECNLIK